MTQAFTARQWSEYARENGYTVVRGNARKFLLTFVENTPLAKAYKKQRMSSSPSLRK
jgi:hypothetical protein